MSIHSSAKSRLWNQAKVSFWAKYKPFSDQEGFGPWKFRDKGKLFVEYQEIELIFHTYTNFLS